MHKQRAEAPKDDDELLIPLPCWGRGRQLVPVNELTRLQFPKKQAAEKPGQSIQSSLLTNSTSNAEETSGGTTPYVQPSGTLPKRVPGPAKNERDEMPHEQESLPGAMAAAAAPAPQRRGIPSSWKMQIAEMIKQPTTARPRTTSRRTRARLAQLPLYACPMPAPVPDARHSGPCLDTAEAQLKAAEVPLKKRPFDPSDYTHPYDLTSWVASLSQMQPGEPSDLDEDNDKYTFHRPLTFEEDSVCEALSTVSLVSSTELEAEFTSEGSTTDALAVMEPMETPRLLETTGDSPTDTPPRGSLEPLPPQEASEMVNRLSCWAPQQRTSHVNHVLKWLCGNLQYHAPVT